MLLLVQCHLISELRVFLMLLMFGARRSPLLRNDRFTSSRIFQLARVRVLYGSQCTWTWVFYNFLWFFSHYFSSFIHFHLWVNEFALKAWFFSFLVVLSSTRRKWLSWFRQENHALPRFRDVNFLYILRISTYRTFRPSFAIIWEFLQSMNSSVLSTAREFTQLRFISGKSLSQIKAITCQSID